MMIDFVDVRLLSITVRGLFEGFCWKFTKNIRKINCILFVYRNAGRKTISFGAGLLQSQGKTTTHKKLVLLPRTLRSGSPSRKLRYQGKTPSRNQKHPPGPQNRKGPPPPPRP